MGAILGLPDLGVTGQVAHQNYSIEGSHIYGAGFYWTNQPRLGHSKQLARASQAPLLRSTPTTVLTDLKQERRAHPRFAVPDLPLKLAGSGSPLRVREISQSGVAFFADSPVAMMTRVKFEIELPTEGDDSPQVSGEGAVVRCERLSPTLGHYEVAVFFQHLNGNSLRDLKDYLARVFD
ncbi:MAG: PilZ domain-containing protein [Planctomycetes bacterium]|nr:PilZ domain-containing protein [Planctomycetota bacterium]